MAKSWVMVALLSLQVVLMSAHNEGPGGFHCESYFNGLVRAEYRPGIITVDGKPHDWANVNGYSFHLRPALDPDEDHQYSAGDMLLKAAHDGHFVYFLLQVPGDYQYLQGKQRNCPSVAFMFQVGANATYHNMGGCKESIDSCSSQTCSGHEVDIMHFSTGTAIPSQLYGANIFDNQNGTGRDSFGHLVDLYAWTPHCRYVDGSGPKGNANNANSTSQNDWQGAWWHDSIDTNSGSLESPYGKAGKPGIFSYEFYRPLRTSDHLHQDVQFSIGETHKFSAAFWYPISGNPWTGSGHYTINCDWISLEILSAKKELFTPSPTSFNALNVITLILSMVAFVVSLMVGWFVRKGKSMPFTPIDNL